MFTVAPHDEGFLVTWPEQASDHAKALRNELLLQGLPRGDDWPTGLVVRRYRNQFETLRMLLEIFERKGIDVTLDPQLVDIRDTGKAESDLIGSIRSVPKQRSPVNPVVAEFRGGRRLLPYQCKAVAKHLFDQHAADFSVPGSGKTTVALADWTILRREVPDLGLWVIGPLSCFRPWEEEFEACFGRPP